MLAQRTGVERAAVVGEDAAERAVGVNERCRTCVGGKPSPAGCVLGAVAPDAAEAEARSALVGDVCDPRGAPPPGLQRQRRDLGADGGAVSALHRLSERGRGSDFDSNVLPLGTSHRPKSSPAGCSLPRRNNRLDGSRLSRTSRGLGSRCTSRESWRLLQIATCRRDRAGSSSSRSQTQHKPRPRTLRRPSNLPSRSSCRRRITGRRSRRWRC